MMLVLFRAFHPLVVKISITKTQNKPDQKKYFAKTQCHTRKNKNFP